MKLPAQSRILNSPFLFKVLSVIGIVFVYAAVEWIGSLHFVERFIPFRSLFSPMIIDAFAHHSVEFLVGMAAITVLSRGHLWSYGINSLNLRTSFRILLRFYAFSFFFVCLVIVLPILFDRRLPSYCYGITPINMAGWMVFQWMAAPVADEILFRGLFQTTLIKYWTETIPAGRRQIPTAIIYSTVIYAAGRSNVSIYGVPHVEFVLALLVGFYCGFLYYTTRSLLIPMLSQAFFYGMPFLVRFAYLLVRQP